MNMFVSLLGCLAVVKRRRWSVLLKVRTGEAMNAAKTYALMVMNEETSNGHLPSKISQVCLVLTKRRFHTLELFVANFSNK